MAKGFALLMGFEAAMAILEKDTRSYFDPSVMVRFRPMARQTFDRQANSSEADARLLLEERVRKHI